MRVALVVGGAEFVAEDLKAAMELFVPDAIYAVNDIGAHLERLEVWCTLHPEFMARWEGDRRKRGFANGYEIVCPPDSELGTEGWKFGKDNGRRVSYRWDGMTSSASSGIYGAKAALDDGFDRVVLAGIPMEAEAGHFMPKSRNSHGAVRGSVWTQHGAFVCGFNKAIPHLMGRVRSMSGKTRNVLGAPDAEWLSQ